MPYKDKKKERRIHFGAKGDFTACGTWWQQVIISTNPNDTTCGNCTRTMDWKEAITNEGPFLRKLSILNMSDEEIIRLVEGRKHE